MVLFFLSGTKLPDPDILKDLMVFGSFTRTSQCGELPPNEVSRNLFPMFEHVQEAGWPITSLQLWLPWFG